MVRQLKLPSEPVSAALAVRFAEALVREAALPPPTGDRLVLAMGEAITNAIRHGNALDPSRHVELVWSGDGSGVWVHVEDEGEGVDPVRLARAALPADPTQTNGRGLFLIRTLADRVEVEGACLRMWFTPRPEETAT
jgi:serine/threonine-protein kinase RsbW